MSAQCPQALPRRPAKLGEGWRKHNARLTCAFTLSVAQRRGECEAVCEADTALMTQRSQVQIPPYKAKPQVRAGFVGYHGPGSCIQCQHGVC
jgi:hypothetical protein